MFYRVRTLVPGALINVSRLDGSRVTFSVDGVQQYGKTNFPTALVYGPAKSAQLRLITCGGRFNRAKHSYDDNIVVFAHQVTSAPLVTA